MLEDSAATTRTEDEHILALDLYLKARIQERVVAELARAKAQGRKLGCPERVIPANRLAEVEGLPVREAARRLGIPRTTLHRVLPRKPAQSTP